MVRRRIRWPAIATLTVLTVAAVWLVANPSWLVPVTTRFVNRHLQAQINGTLTVGEYHVRPFVGFDLRDVSLSIEGDNGGMTLVSVDTLELDFRLREVLRPQIRLHRCEAKGVEVYHHLEANDEGGGGSLPRLDIDLMVIKRAHVEVSGSDGRLRERIDRLDWRGAIHSDGESLELTTRAGHLLWPTRSSSFDEVSGDVRVEAGRVHVDGFHAVWNGGAVTLSGWFGMTGDMEFDAIAAGAKAETVTDLTGLELAFDALGDIQIAVVAEADTVWLDAVFTGRFDTWDVEAMHGEAVIANGVATFHTLRGQVGDASFNGNLTVDATDSLMQTITITCLADPVDLKAGLIPEVDPDELPRTSGRARLSIVHTTDDEATHVTGMMFDGAIEDIPFDTCEIDVWAQADSLHFRGIDLRYRSLQIELEGRSDRREVFTGDVRLSIDDLRDVPPHWQWPPVAGRAAGRAKVSGRIEEIGLSGRVQYDGLTVGPMLVGRGTAAVWGERVIGDAWVLDVDATGAGFELGSVPLGQYRLRLRADAHSVAIDSFAAVRGDTVSTIRGRADFEPTHARLSVDRFGLLFAGNQWRLDNPITAEFGPGRLRIPGLRLQSDQGNLFAEADYSVADSLLQGRLELNRFDLDLLDPFVRGEFSPGGYATARVTVQGSPTSPEVIVVGGLDGAYFDVARVDSLETAARFRDGIVTVDTLAVATDYGRVSMRGTISNPNVSLREFWRGAVLDLDAHLERGDLLFLEQFELEALDRLSGTADGRFYVRGRTDDPVITGNVTTAPLTYQWLKLDELTSTVRVDRSQFALGDLVGRQDNLRLEGRLEIPLSFDLLSAPESPVDGPFLVQIRIPTDSDLGPLLDATSAFTKVSGRGEGELIISGPMSHPLYQGDVELRDAGCVLRGNQEIYHDCDVTGSFNGDRLVLHSINGREGLRGSFKGQGHVLFDGLILRTWDIGFEADRFLVASIPDLRAVVRTRNGRLTGVPVGPDSLLVPKFTGDFEIIKGRYTGDFAEPAAGVADPTLGTIAPDWLADGRITGPPRSVRIVNNTMELDLSGDINLVRDADGMVLSGSMDIDSGRLPVFHNTFKVVRGSLDFSREVGVIPNVDIDAETRVRIRNQASGSSVVERITVHALGPAGAMAISYSSESGYPREAIERMLLGLSPYPDEQGDQTALANASIGAGFNLLEREIAREFDLFDTIEIDQLQREEAGTVGLDPLFGVGKYLGSDLYIKYAQGLNQNDRDLLVEYQINRLLLLQTEIRRRIDEYQGDATYNLDLKYRHEY